MDRKHSANDAFLEAHYYSSGLRYRHITDQGDRPDWAPPPDEVGFRNDIPLTSGDIVIEFQRRLYNQKRVTWLGVYEWAVDKRLGDRENHSGLGVWLREGVIASPYSTLDYLIKILVAYRDNLDHQRLENEAKNLLKEVIVQSIIHLDNFAPGFTGSPFSEYPLLNNSFYFIKDSFGPQSIQLAADQISLLSFTPNLNLSARAIIIISSEQKSPRSGEPVVDLGAGKRGIIELIERIPDGITIERQAVSEIRRRLDKSEENLKLEIQHRRKLEDQIDLFKKSSPSNPLALNNNGKTDEIYREIINLKEIMNQFDRKLSLREKTIYTETYDDDRDDSKIQKIIMGISVFILAAFALCSIGFVGYLIFNNFIR